MKYPSANAFLPVLFTLPFVISDANVDDIVSSWIDIDIAFRAFSKQVAEKFSTIRPAILSADISSKCSESLSQLQEGLNQSRAWAFKMLDASGKIPSGFLIHNYVSLGDYYECVDIDVPDLFQGKYCFIEFKLPLPTQQLLVPAYTEIPELQNLTDPNSV